MRVGWHRRIQDFVRGGGGKALLPPPGSAPDYLGEQYFVGRGGAKAPLAPPGSAPGWGGWTSLLGLDEGWVGRVDFTIRPR